MKNNKIFPLLLIALLTIPLGLANDFNLPLHWVLTEAGTSVDNDEDGIIDNAETLDNLDSTYFVYRNDWTTLNNYPSACGAGQFVIQIGDTLTCATPSYYDGADFATDLAASTTDNLSEGSNNLYYTNSRVLTLTNPIFVNRSDWTTIDNYPSACPAGQFVTQIGDTLTCATPTDNDTIYWTQNNTDLYYTTGNVSIGRINPSAKLHVATDSGTIPSSTAELIVSDTGSSTDTTAISVIAGASGNSYLNFGDTADENVGLIAYNHGSDSFNIRTSGSGVDMAIASDGDVGIGTTSPGAVLDITGTGSGGRGLRIVESTTAKANSVYTLEIDSSAHTSNLASAGALAVDVNSGRAFTIDGQGDVGVGNITPEAELHVVSSGSTGEIKLGDSADNDYLRLLSQAVGGVSIIDTDGVLVLKDSGNETMRLSGNKVGIGDTTPDVLLDLERADGAYINLNDPTASGLASLNSEIRFQYGGTTGAVIGTDANSQFKIGITSAAVSSPVTFYTANAEAMRIESDGDVGIGTAAPGRRLEVADTTPGSVTRIRINGGGQSGDGGAGIELMSEDVFQWQIMHRNETTHGNEKHALAFTTVANDYSNAKLLIEQSGNVGVGTSDPLKNLHVSSSGSTGIRVDSTGNLNTELRLQAARTSSGQDISQINGYWETNRVASVIFQTGADTTNKDDGTVSLWTAPNGTAGILPRLMVNREGDVGIGTTSPDSKLHVYGNNPKITLEDDDVDRSNYIQALSGDNMVLAVDDGNAGSDSYMGFQVDGSEVMRMEAGQMAIGTTSPHANSLLHVYTSGDGPSTIIAESQRPTLVLKETNGNANENWQLRTDSGDLQIQTQNDALSGASSQIVVEQSGDVGIGTSGPQNKLDVEGGVVIGSSYSGTNTAPTNGLAVEGDVGIGTTTPQHELDVDGTMRSTHDVVSNAQYNVVAFGSDRSLDDYGGLNKDYWRMKLVTPGASTTGESSQHAYGDLRFSAVDGADTTYHDLVTFRHNGNVGIGTTTPSEELDVDITSGTEGGMTVTSNSIGTLGLFLDNSLGPHLVAHTDSDGDSTGNFVAVRQIFAANGYQIATSPATAAGVARTFTTRFVVDTDGDVGIGTVSPNGRLEVKSAGNSSNPLRIVNSNSANLLFSLNQDSTGDAALGLYDVSGNVNVYLDADSDSYVTGGDFGIGATSPARTLHINDTMRLEPRSTAPSSAGAGDLYYDSDNGLPCVYTGSRWRDWDNVTCA